eukprot:scaffold157111_cov36-Tisochrysis_lutea.AAC.4
MLHPNDVWTLVESEFNASPISLCTPLLERASFAPREKACILTYLGGGQSYAGCNQLQLPKK